MGPSAQIGVHWQDALAINYNSGTTLNYLSSVGSEGAINGNINVNVANGSFNNQTASPAITEALIGTAYGQSSAAIDGNVNVSITNGEFYGNVKAASASGNNGALGGRASIKIGTAEEAFTGGFNAKINDGFASLEVSNADTEVNFANAFNVETLSVESGAKIGLAEGTSFEKFSIVFEGEFSGGETIDYADVLADAETQTVVLSAIESGAQFTVFGGDQEWSTVFDNGQFTVGAAIPEPAEFAAFLGILAIFCAAARRR